MEKAKTILCDSVIFDLDGTLWNPEAVCTKGWLKVLETVDLPENPLAEKGLDAVFGLQAEDIARELLPQLDEEKQEEILNLCFKEELDLIKKEGGVLFPGIQEVLRLLSRKYPLFIVSNCQSGYIEAFFEYHKMDSFFDDIECPGNTGLSKDKNIQLIIERNGLENPVYVGDTEGDFHASRENSIPFIFAAYGFGQVAEPPYTINRLTELPALLGVNG